MIITITLILAFLVAVNFLLLAFSCNKTSKKQDTVRPLVASPQKPTPKLVANQSRATQLVPTGS